MKKNRRFRRDTGSMRIRDVARRELRENWQELLDCSCGEINATRLAELTAQACDWDSAIDDETHPLWIVAMDVAQAAERQAEFEECIARGTVENLRRAQGRCGRAQNRRWTDGDAACGSKGDAE